MTQKMVQRVKRAYSSSRGLGLSSWQPVGSAQSCVTLVAGSLMPSSGFFGYQAYKQYHIIEKLKIFKRMVLKEWYRKSAGNHGIDLA